ncbi:cobyric acid synthase [Halorubrum sp. AD140]|uniref:cobyric acid synthase n=1 Tax=Halorubrum sp. AD140 TaxID=3050073 RepID=UPI002ACCD21E|nr:cobyric acid synthase [Halorubrum sp. AD140]MDZ5811159.1 cobyric acid synthase [Halorubrum sp. AD140]
MTDPGLDAETLLIAGTASHAGKSTLAAGLCRHLSRNGVAVVPFKAQNMSNNARVALAPDGEWGEIGVSQYVQARAAGVPATTDMNPVLLKPRGDGESQLVIDGEAVGHYAAGEYYESHWEAARNAAVAAHRRLAADHDVIVAEGAGSIAEINLHDRDLANVECVRFADARILIAVDIERGGAFASLYGTLELLPDDLRERVAGAVVTKFRGDPALLEPGIAEIEERTGVPIVGVVPHDDPGLPAEDSLSLPEAGEGGETGGGREAGAGVLGAGDGVADADAVRIAVPRLPRISNFTDLEPLAREPGVRVVYVPIDASRGEADDAADALLDDADAVVLPGSKNTVDDLLALRDAGFDEALRGFSGPIVGLCGGYQILGERLTNADVEGTGSATEVEGVGALPVETRFETEKRVERVTRSVEGVGPLAGASGTASGYEIHMGRSSPTAAVARPLGPESAATDRALGTYLHGLFENENVREAFVERVFAAAGRPRPAVGSDDGNGNGESGGGATARAGDRSPYDRAADLVSENVDLVAVGPGALGLD